MKWSESTTSQLHCN